MPRTRRPNVVIIPLKLWLIPSTDDDLIGYLQSIPAGKRAAAVKQAMRGGLSSQTQQVSEDEEINDLLDTLGDRLGE
jgi:hypothetical protein